MPGPPSFAGDVEVVGISQGGLPKDPAFLGFLVPEPQPLGVVVEALGGDGGVIGRMPQGEFRGLLLGF
jgi:hypothetical protein